MTTVIAYAAGQHTIMAGDTMTNVYARPVEAATKVVRFTTTKGEPYLMGFAGEGAGPSVVGRHHTIECLPDFSSRRDRDNWANAVATGVTQTFIEHSLLDGQRQDGAVLLAAAGHVWTLTHHQAIVHPDGIAAIGSGEGPAIGALDALLAVGHDPVDAVVRACQAGMKYDQYSGGRVRLRVLPSVARMS